MTEAQYAKRSDALDRYFSEQEDRAARCGDDAGVEELQRTHAALTDFLDARFTADSVADFDTLWREYRAGTIDLDDILAMT